MVVTTIVLDQTCLASLVGSIANSLSFFVEVGVFQVLPRGALIAFVVALAATKAMFSHCRTECSHSWCRITLAPLGAFLVP